MLSRGRTDTRDRILDGAAQAIALHGLAKLDMGDVSHSSGVSRGTLYRYFPTRDRLLVELARHEGERLRARMHAAIAEAPAGPERILVAAEHATRHVREHPVLQRILETDPAFVLRALREQFPLIKAELEPMLGPLLAETALARGGIATAQQLLDWTVRLMISAYLFPDDHPDGMARGLTATYQVLTKRRAVRRRPPARVRGSA